MRSVFGDASARRAAVMIAANADVARRFEHVHPIVEPNAVVDSATPTRVSSTGGRRALFIGRLVAWKGGALAIAALACPEAEEWTLDVFGDGPERGRLARLARRLDVSSRVRFRGRRPRAEVLAALAEGDALLFPSMHDSGGWVVAEATGVGCPVICLDRGGPPILAAGNGVVVPTRGCTPKSLAMALSVVGSSARSTRWSASRLPAVLSNAFDRAAGVTTPPSAHAYD
jgi:glycosyltransferase involved in cell wall biosynthesis